MSIQKYVQLDAAGFVRGVVLASEPPQPLCPEGSVELFEEELPANTSGPGTCFHLPTRSWLVADREQLAARVASQVRETRNQLLQATDWTQGKDALSRITKQQQAEWAAYRQALCDITDQPEFPFNVQWPSRPG